MTYQYVSGLLPHTYSLSIQLWKSFLLFVLGLMWHQLHTLKIRNSDPYSCCKKSLHGALWQRLIYALLIFFLWPVQSYVFCRVVLSNASFYPLPTEHICINNGPCIIWWEVMPCACRIWIEIIQTHQGLFAKLSICCYSMSVDQLSHMFTYLTRYQWIIWMDK